MKKQKKTLHLVLKAVWYDMIESGIKKEEYRTINPYWIKRLSHETGYGLEYNDFDIVTFHYGYTNRTMEFELADIEEKTGRPEWGATEGEKYFVLTLGNRIQTTNQ